MKYIHWYFDPFIDDWLKQRIVYACKCLVYIDEDFLKTLNPIYAVGLI